MGERKVLNKYIPADFDPSLVPRSKKPKDGMVTVRMMLPFSVQCSTCSTFLYRGRKFNSKKEAVDGPDGKYLGIQRYRFYIKCTGCSRPVTFLTDPKNADYEMESGATRNYEVYKDKEKTEEEQATQKQEEEKEDPMKALENRVLESQREMQDLDNLEEIKAMNMRHLQLLSQAKAGEVAFGDDTKAVMLAREVKSVSEALNEHGLTESEEALVKSIKFGQKPAGETGALPIRRLNKDDEKKFEECRKKEALLLEKTKPAKSANPTFPIIKVKRKRVHEPDAPKKPKSEAEEEPNDNLGGGLVGLLGGYGSDSD
jgi:hypothetical protein